MTSGKAQQSKGPGKGPVSRLSRWLRFRRTAPITPNPQESSEDEAGFGEFKEGLKNGSEESKEGLEETHSETSAEGNGVHCRGTRGAAKKVPAQQRPETPPADRVTRAEDPRASRTNVSEIEEAGPAERESSGGNPPPLFKGVSLPVGFGQRHTRGWVSNNPSPVDRAGGLRTAASDISSLLQHLTRRGPPARAALPSGDDDASWLIASLLCTALLCLTFGGVAAVCVTALVGMLATPLCVPSIFQKKQLKPPPLMIQDPSSKSPEILPTPLQKKPPQRPPASEPIPSFRPRGATPLGRRTPRTSFSTFTQPAKAMEPPDFDLGEPAAVKPRGSWGSVARFGAASVPNSGRNTPQATTPSPAPLSNRSPNTLVNRSPNPLSNHSDTSERDFVDPAPGVAPKWPAAAAPGDDVSRAGLLDCEAAKRILGVLILVLAALLWSRAAAVLGTAVAVLCLGVHVRNDEQKVDKPAGLLVSGRTQSAPAVELVRLSRSAQNTPRVSTVSPNSSILPVHKPGRVEDGMKRRHSASSKLVY